MTDREPAATGGVDALSERDKAVGKHVVDIALDGDEPAPVRLAVRAAAIALDRRGRDLERDEQRWQTFGDVLDATVADVLDHFDDGDADVDGVEGLVFEGFVVDHHLIVDEALEYVEMIELDGGIDRDSPGGLVERVDGSDGDQA